MAASKRARFSALLAGAAFLFSASGAAAETLMDALALAYETNPTLRAERANLRATDEAFIQARAGGLPQVQASGGYTRTEITSSGGFANLIGEERNLDTWTTTVDASQRVFGGLATWNRVRQASAQIRAGRASLKNVEQSVLLEAVTAYMDVRRDEATVGLNDNNVTVLERQLQAARDRFAVGEVTRTDVAQSEARLSGVEAQLISAKAQLTNSRAAYVRIVGQMPGTLDAPPALPQLPQSQDEALLMARRHNPQLVAAREAETASRRAVAASKGDLTPSVDAIAQFNQSWNQQVAGDETDTVAVGARVNVPIFVGGANHSRVRQAKQQNSRDRLGIVEAERAVQEAVAVAWEGLQASRAVLVAAEAQVKANEIALDGVRQESQVGSRTTLDVLNAEQELLDAQVGLERARRDEYVSGFSLLSAIGGLTAENLDLAVEAYDPEKNLRRVRWMLVGFGGVKDE